MNKITYGPEINQLKTKINLAIKRAKKSKKLKAFTSKLIIQNQILDK